MSTNEKHVAPYLHTAHNIGDWRAPANRLDALHYIAVKYHLGVSIVANDWRLPVSDVLDFLCGEHMYVGGDYLNVFDYVYAPVDDDSVKHWIELNDRYLRMLDNCQYHNIEISTNVPGFDTRYRGLNRGISSADTYAFSSYDVSTHRVRRYIVSKNKCESQHLKLVDAC
jgi:hypothetical protein